MRKDTNLMFIFSLHTIYFNPLIAEKNGGSKKQIKQIIPRATPYRPNRPNRPNRLILTRHTFQLPS